MPLSRVCPYCKSSDIVRAGFSSRLESFQKERRQRLRCTQCKRRFSAHVGSLFYYFKKLDPALNAKIFYLMLQGSSNRSIGRFLMISEHCIRIRMQRLARQALSFQSTLLKDYKIGEPLCFDGLENFSGSQYDPNNIQQAIGRDSLFIYDFNFASLNRKGHMSEWQKRRLFEIEKEHGRYNPKSIRMATYEIIQRLYKKRDPNKTFILLSDEHFQYRRVVGRDLKHLKIDHITISSKACRNFQNILFPVNHADLMIRQQIGAFSRETISFSKTAGAMCQKYTLYMIYKNYMAPQFTKKHVRRPEAHTKSPAQHVGLVEKILGFPDIFYRQSLEEDLSAMNSDWRLFWQGKIPSKHARNQRFNRTNQAA